VLVALVALSAALSGCAASPPDTTGTAGATTAKAAPACQSEQPLGSRVAKRVCRSEEQKQVDREDAERLQREVRRGPRGSNAP
jgi:hypothetical protein